MNDASKAVLPPTVSHILGEMTWLLTQSQLHRVLALSDLEWLVMPALMYEQYYVFRDGDKPVGLALWAYCNEVAEAKLDRGIIEPANRLTPEEWKSGDQLWLIDLIAPFASDENRHREIMIADLISGPLKGKAFKFHHTDLATGKREARTIEADASDKLKAKIEEMLQAQG